MKSATPYLALMLVISVMVAIGQTSKLNKAEEIIKQKDLDIQTVENDAYRECQIWMSRSKLISEVNGCYKTLEILCSGTKKPVDCINQLSNVCQQLGE